MLVSRVFPYLFFFCLISHSTSRGCDWDRDTLAKEALGLPGIVDIIVGRFERQPPRYYSMRLERVTKELGADPTRLDLYDDAAVACDKLGRLNEAINWMGKKRSELDKRDFLNAEVYEHWYRYHANLGTFYAHRWLMSGANRNDLSDIKTGRDLIAKAIEINPDAHFGREKWQLMAMEWIIDLPNAEENIGYFHLNGVAVLYHQTSKERMLPDGRILEKMNTEGATKGLAGMIVLGNAWQSVDVYFALGFALINQGDSSLGILAYNRMYELLNEGKRSLHPKGPTVEHGFQLLDSQRYQEPVEHVAPLNEFFQDARQAAHEWQVHRIKFMHKQFAKGMHPDTHTFFWDGYKELDNAPPLPGEETGIAAAAEPEMDERDPGSMIMLVIALSLLVVALVIAAVQTVRTQRRRHTT